MKHLIGMILVCAVGYLLYDKFMSSNGETASRLKSVAQSRMDGLLAKPQEVPFQGLSPKRPDVQNCSLAKMEHPETMTDEERQMAEGWGDAKSRYFVELDQLKAVYRKKVAIPYRYNQQYAEELRSAIVDLETAINYDDFLVVPRRRDIAADALRRFESSCSWQAGVSRGNGMHMHSAFSEGRWEPDNGYTLVNRGGELIAVQVSMCRECRGMGYLVQKVTCQNCNGRGRIANPMSQVGDAVSLIGGIMSGNGKRRMPRMPKQRSEIVCSACNRGKVDRRIQCPSCGGRGKVFK